MKKYRIVTVHFIQKKTRHGWDTTMMKYRNLKKARTWVRRHNGRPCPKCSDGDITFDNGCDYCGRKGART